MDGNKLNILPFKKKKKTKAEIIFIVAMLCIPLLYFCVFWIYVNIDSFFLAFKQFKIETGTWEWVGFENFKTLYRDLVKEGSVLPKGILNSISVFLWNDFVIVPISMFCAYILYKKMPMGGFYKVVFFLPSLISVVVLTLSFSYMLNNFIPSFFEKIGIADKIPFDGYLGDHRYAWWMVLLYGLWSGIGYNIVLFSGAMTRVPNDLVEAGQLDGLTLMKELWYIDIPLIGATISTLMLLGTTVIFTYFLQPKLLFGGSADIVGGYTIALYIVNNVREGGTVQLAMGATVGLVCAIIGTPIVIGMRKILEKVFPTYEY